jgi:hypothetical protein
VLTGRYAKVIEQGDELWQAWACDGTDRRWLAPAFNLTALAHGLSNDGQFERWRARTSTVTNGLAQQGPTPKRTDGPLRRLPARGRLHESREEPAAAAAKYGHIGAESERKYTLEFMCHSSRNDGLVQDLAP